MKKQYIFITFALISVIILFLIFKPKTEKIKIGCIGTFVGRHSEWGVGARDGLQILVNRLNKSGGINGKEIELIIRNLSDYKDNYTKIIDELISQKVVVIFGPGTSSDSVKLLPIINKRKILLLSPSASSDALCCKDDYFLRTVQPNDQMSQFLAEYLHKKLKWRNVTAAYSLENAVYNEGWFIAFKKNFEKVGGKIKLFTKFKSDTNFTKIAEELIRSNPDGIFISASALNTAVICQEIRKINKKVKISVNDGAGTEFLIQSGGDAAEGILLPTSFFIDYSNKLFKEFADAIKEDLSSEPTYSIQLGYDGAKVLLEVLKQCKDYNSDEIKKTLLQIKEFDSPQGKIIFNKYGDVYRNLKMLTVKDGRYIEIK